MRIQLAIIVAWGLCLVTTPGCNQVDTLFGFGTKPSEEDRQPNPRLRLLARLTGQAKQEKLLTLLNIVQNDPEKVLRLDALNYLSGLGVEAKPISESLAKQLLIESDEEVVRGIRQVLVDSQANVAATLLPAASSADAELLMRIAQTLGDTHSTGPETIEFFQRQMSSSNPDVVAAVARSLEKIGPAAQPLLPQLIAVADRQRNLTQACVRAIAAIGADESALPLLTMCLEMEPLIAAAASKALSGLGAKARPALPALEKLMNRDDHGGKDIKTRLAREAAINAINAIEI